MVWPIGFSYLQGFWRLPRLSAGQALPEGGQVAPRGCLGRILLEHRNRVVSLDAVADLDQLAPRFPATTSLSTGQASPEGGRVALGGCFVGDRLGHRHLGSAALVPDVAFPD